MKVNLIAKPTPWTTWDKQLWKENASYADPLHTIVLNTKNTDAEVIEWYSGIDPDISTANMTVWFVPNIKSKDDIPEIKKLSMKDTIVTNSMAVNNLLINNGMFPSLWKKPSRVSKKMMFNDMLEMTQKSNDFTLSCNVSDKESNMEETIRSYFSVCVDRSEGGTIGENTKMDIFSAYDLPMEPFNNIIFNGMQPNPVMFKKIKKSKLFIYPHVGHGVPTTAIDAVMLGTPILVRNSEVNRSVFTWNENTFYSSEEELIEKINYYMDISFTGKEYCDILLDNYGHIASEYSVDSCHASLMDILDG